MLPITSNSLAGQEFWNLDAQVADVIWTGRTFLNAFLG